MILDLDGETGPHRAAGLVPRDELSWSRVEDPTRFTAPGRRMEGEVIAVDRSRGQVLLSARACEDRPLRAFLLARRRGEVVTGTVTEVHNFGVFVRLDGEPATTRTGYPGTGFVHVPEVSWLHIDHVSDVVDVGLRIAAEVLDADTRRGQVAVSLRALQDDPLIPLAGRVGERVPGRVTKLSPLGVFVRVADGIEGLLPLSDPLQAPVRVGQPVTVTIAGVEPLYRRVLLAADSAREDPGDEH